jgi:Predicted nucleic acid-binding protein, contains PIN domain
MEGFPAVIAVDTNLLVYAHRAGCAEHAAARRAIERAAASPDGWCIPLPCVFEFWSVVTHPSCVGGPSPPAVALDFIDSLLSTGETQVLQPGADFAQRCFRKASNLSMSGPRVFDLQIGLIALEAGVTELWTHDAGFVALPGLKVVDPLADRGGIKARGRR